MPPYRHDFALPPLTRQLKAQLIDLASEFRLASDGTVANLRLRIRNYLVANPALLANQRYSDLLPNHRPPDSPPPSYETLPSQTNLNVPNRTLGFGAPSHGPTPRPSLSPPHPRVKGRPPIVQGRKVEHPPFLIPEAIRKSVIRGWLEHIPLTYLTDQFCIPGLDQGIKGQHFGLNRHTGTDTEEHNLSFEDWHCAWLRFLQLLRTYLPTLHGPWKMHFERICFAPDCSSNWSTWLAYDISLRRQSVYDGIDPRIFHQLLWHQLYMESVKKSIFRPSANPITQSSPHSSRHTRKPSHSNNSATFRRSTSHAPYGNRPRPDQGERGNSHRCLKCGGPHMPRGCFAPTQVNGLPVVILPRRNGKFMGDAEGNRYCFAFNGLAGCADTNCYRGHHRCTLCKGLDHDAQSCPSV